MEESKSILLLNVLDDILRSGLSLYSYSISGSFLAKVLMRSTLKEAQQ